MKHTCCADANGDRPEFNSGFHRGSEAPAALHRGSAGASPSRHIATRREMVLKLSDRHAGFRVLHIVAGVLFASLTAGQVHATTAQSDQIDGSQIDKVGEEVMQGNEFRSVRRTVLEKLPETDIDKGFLQGVLDWVGRQIGNMFDAIADFFRWLFSGFKSPGQKAPPPTAPSGSFDWNFGLGSLSSVFTIAMIAVIAVVLIVIIAMIVKSIDTSKRRREGLLSDSDDVLSDVTTPPGELAASTYESRALQFASAGNYRAAIRELLLGSMSWIERAGLIRYRKGLTNRDYVRSVWRRTDKREGYLATASQFEFVYFGRRTPTAEMFETCLASFQGAFREEEAPTAAV